MPALASQILADARRQIAAARTAVISSSVTTWPSAQVRRLTANGAIRCIATAGRPDGTTVGVARDQPFAAAGPSADGWVLPDPGQELTSARVRLGDICIRKAHLALKFA